MLFEIKLNFKNIPLQSRISASYNFIQQMYLPVLEGPKDEWRGWPCPLTAVQGRWAAPWMANGAHWEATRTLPRGTRRPCRCAETWGPGHRDTYQPDTRPAATLKLVLVALQNFAAMLIVFLLLGHYRGSLRSPPFAFKWKMKILPKEEVG